MTGRLKNCLFVLPWLILLFFLLVGAIIYRREKVIASFATSLKGRTPNQIHNLDLAGKTLNGIIIKPGDIFSFNKAVGPWSREKGYRKAPVSYTGLMVPAWGGGVCQASTTLYNAVLLAGLEIIERGPHYWAPNYISPGRDAAVAYGELDLKFRNNFPQPIRIRARIIGDKFLVQILSRYRPPYQVEILSEEEEIKPAKYTLIGELGATPKPKSGYRVNIYRVFLKDGKEINREILSSDEYPPLPKILYNIP